MNALCSLCSLCACAGSLAHSWPSSGTATGQLPAAQRALQHALAASACPTPPLLPPTPLQQQPDDFHMAIAGGCNKRRFAGGGCSNVHLSTRVQQQRRHLRLVVQGLSGGVG